MDLFLFCVVNATSQIQHFQLLEIVLLCIITLQDISRTLSSHGITENGNGMEVTE